MKSFVLLVLLLIPHLIIHAELPLPVASYPFSGNANDQSGNNNNGTINGATLTNDRFDNINSAYLFDGINDVISIPSSTTLNAYNELSISVWIKPSSFPSSGSNMILGKSNYSSNTNYLIRVQPNGNIQFEYKTFANTGNHALILNQWNHIVVTSNLLNEKQVYINNVSVTFTTNTSPYGIVTNPLTVGAAGYNSEYFNGSIDDILIYNAVLTEMEISALFINTPTNMKVSKSSTPAKIAISNKTILFNQPIEDINQISVYNVTGLRVYQTSIITSTIDLNMLLKGMYLLKIQHLNQLIDTQKIILK